MIDNHKQGQSYPREIRMKDGMLFEAIWKLIQVADHRLASIKKIDIISMINKQYYIKK